MGPAQRLRHENGLGVRPAVRHEQQTMAPGQRPGLQGLPAGLRWMLLSVLRRVLQRVLRQVLSAAALPPLQARLLTYEPVPYVLGTAHFEGMVLEAGLSVPLLGMSFLNRMDMRRDGQSMTLIQR